MKDEGKIISIFIFKKIHTHERSTEKCVIYFFFGGSTFNCGLHVSARDRVKRCTNVLLCERDRVCVVLCKYLSRAQEGKEKKARTKTNQHYPVRARRAVFTSIQLHKKRTKTWKSKRGEGNKRKLDQIWGFPRPPRD